MNNTESKEPSSENKPSNTGVTEMIIEGRVIYQFNIETIEGQVI